MGGRRLSQPSLGGWLDNEMVYTSVGVLAAPGIE